MSDGRPLQDRVRAIGNRFAAIASGMEKHLGKDPRVSLQVIQTYRREAQTLIDAADTLSRQALP